MDERRSGEVRPAVRCALAVSTAMAMVALGAAWQGVSATSRPQVRPGGAC